MLDPDTHKTALVIASGGAHGAFAVGAVDYLVHVAKKKFNVFAGTSTGALIAPLVATDNLDVLLHTYQSVQTTDILSSRPAINALTLQDALTSADPLYTIIENTFTEERSREILADHRVFLATVNLASGHTVIFHTGEHPPQYAHFNNRESKTLTYLPIKNRKTLIDAIKASSAIPIYMPPVQVKADESSCIIPAAGPLDDDCIITPADWYVDGGVREVAPLRAAIDEGAHEIYAILLAPSTTPRSERFSQEEPPRVLSTLGRIIGLFLDEMLENEVANARTNERIRNDFANYIKNLKEELIDTLGQESDIEAVFERLSHLQPLSGQSYKLYVIRPKSKLPGGGRDFIPQQMSYMMELGWQEAEESLKLPMTITI